jgi:hypothetical protein
MENQRSDSDIAKPTGFMILAGKRFIQKGGKTRREQFDPERALSEPYPRLLRV